MESKLRLIRRYFADYVRSEGCSCCQDIEGHKVAMAVLAGLLEIDEYEDGSGFNVYKYCSGKEAKHGK